MAASFQVVHKFDPIKKRHYLNDWNSVLHCHHYSTLYTQLAIDAEELGGVANLVKAGEKVFGGLLKDYYEKSGVDSVEDRVEVAKQYWKNVGMGLIDITVTGESSGLAQMDYSHLDEGWLKKWGGTNRPVNFFTQGFLAGACAAIFNKPLGSYFVEETKSLVKGDDVSEFAISLK
jgi:predicted hydrocarbon binding protein